MGFTSGRQAAMPFIMVTVLLDMMSIRTHRAGVAAKLIGSFMDSGAGTAFAYGAAQFVFAIAQFFARPFWRSSDPVTRRRPVLLLVWWAWRSIFFCHRPGQRPLDVAGRAFHGRRIVRQRGGGQRLRR